MFVFSVTALGYAVSVILLLGLAFLVFLKNPKERLNQLFFGLAVTAALFGISLIIGSSVTNETIAYIAWMINIVDIFIVIFYAHFMLKVVGRDHAYRYFIALTYIVGVGLVALAIIFPTLFLPEVTPKLSYTYYLNPGPLYHLMVALFFFIPVLPVYELVRAYLRGGKDRFQAEYFLLGSLIGYSFGSLAFLLVYDIPVDPLYAMFYGLWTVPIAYGIVSRQLLDIRVVVRRAAVYASVVAVVTTILITLILLSNFFAEQLPHIQFWIVPLIAAFAGVFFARFYWTQSIEADQLKYEFITIATHKLRTPLTRMNWETGALLEEKLTPSMRASVEDIDAANKELIEITHVLFEAAKANDSQGADMKGELDLKKLTSEAIHRFGNLSEDKGVRIALDAPEEVYSIVGDRSQISSVIGIFVENALMYGKKDGLATISLSREGNDITFSITDDGIGINSKDQRYVFDRFFRTSKAKLADTEGLGLGLSLAKSVIKRHHGKVGVLSEGEGKGSTFWFSIPAK